MKDPVVEVLSRTLWHHYLPLATPGLWAGSHSPTLLSPLHPRAFRQDTQTHATVSTVGAQAANTARTEGGGSPRTLGEPEAEAVDQTPVQAKVDAHPHRKRVKGQHAVNQSQESAEGGVVTDLPVK